VAGDFIAWLEPAPNARWIDIGCGTGALTEAILAGARPARVSGVDPAPDFVAFARARSADPRVSFSVADADHLPTDDGPYDYTVSGLVLNFLPHMDAAVQEMRRATRAGGCVAAYVWDYAEGMEMMRQFWDAAAELDSRAASLDEGVRFPICRPGPLRLLWERAGLLDVAVRPLEVETVFRDLDDYWSPFLGGQGPAPTYVMSLGASGREELKKLLRRRLPTGDDGRIRLRARAWAVRGRTMASELSADESTQGEHDPPYVAV
jgi:SAM-dependent methyltransferase